MTDGDHRDRAADIRPVLLGVSLKLYLDVAESADWAAAVAVIAGGHAAVRSGAVRLFVLPSLPALPMVRAALEGSGVEVGAQNLHWQDRGAFTGEVSGQDLSAVGCSHVEVGHAERRSMFGETDDIVRRKLQAALRNGLTPVLCVGESDREPADDAAQTCIAQLTSALAGLDAPACAQLIVAYEPVWAIGQPVPAPTEHVRRVADALRAFLQNDPRTVGSSVIYGGSAQPGSLTELGQSVDGLFLGRFAHNPADLGDIIDEAAVFAQRYEKECG